jgi:hypothetical protein
VDHGVVTVAGQTSLHIFTHILRSPYGAASILLGLLAIWLSVHFYTRDQALFLERHAQRDAGSAGGVASK